MTPRVFEQWLLLIPVAVTVFLFTLTLIKTWFRDQGMLDDPSHRREPWKGDDEDDGA